MIAADDDILSLFSFINETNKRLNCRNLANCKPGPEIYDDYQTWVKRFYFSRYITQNAKKWAKTCVLMSSTTIKINSQQIC